MPFRKFLILVLLTLAGGLGLWVLLSIHGNSQLRVSLEADRTIPTQFLKGGKAVSGTSLTAAAAEVTATATLVAPRYTGMDEKGRSWELVADMADQTGGASDTVVTLTSMTAVLSDPNKGLQIHLTAPHGDYATDAQTVSLTGGVAAHIVEHGRSLDFTAPSASGNLAVDATKLILGGGVKGRVETNEKD